ncbi:hypothetical protein Poli38472_000785 [Pythium oligandrum]|uniref:FYVE-type domain-containing protein n=1 Tax=Pythium oligandrum TaxID=41045 RepID=A0A8K1CDT0_PYTOL|nr:hypothetical protein Poli38472_000785 [Pythium oligandrum]|eukprot:TMW60743.1 hypothetical protein Poli38472_000785 [Pythium oligandrum]
MTHALTSPVGSKAAFTYRTKRAPKAMGSYRGSSSAAFPRFSDDEDASGHKEAVEQSIPLSVLQKQETQAANSLTDSDSSTPVSPQADPEEDVRDNLVSEEEAVTDEDGEYDEEDDDTFVPGPVHPQATQSSRPTRQSVPLNVAPMPNSEGKNRNGLTNRWSTGELLRSGRRPIDRASSLDSRENTRESIDFRTSGGAARESMMKYRPSDIDAMDLKNNLMGRDSLAPDSDATIDASRGSLLHTSSRTSDVELPDLLRAAKIGNKMLLKAILHERNIDLLQVDPVHQQTALHFAIRHGRFAAVRTLCQKKGSEVMVNAGDVRGNTPLHLAVARSRRITKYLLENTNADVTASNLRGQSVLGVYIVTAKRDDPLVAEMLLQHQADPNAMLDRSTLLHRAVDRGLYEIAGRLVRFGARLDVKDEHDKMVFDKVNRKVLRQLLLKISYPPVWVPDEERPHCMLCSRKFNRFGVGVRRHHCRHCGRLCCGDCSHVSVDCDAFPKTFEKKFDQEKSSSRHDAKKRVCKTCSAVFHERQKPQEEKKMMVDFMEKVIGCSWDEVKRHSTATPGSTRDSIA